MNNRVAPTNRNIFVNGFLRLRVVCETLKVKTNVIVNYWSNNGITIICLTCKTDCIWEGTLEQGLNHLVMAGDLECEFIPSELGGTN